MVNKMHCDTYQSPMGTLWLAGEQGILKELSFGMLPGEPAAPGEFDSVKRWLDAYFRGEPREPEFPMEPKGTPFQQLVWKLLLEIPFGETRTYGELARQAAQIMGKEKMSAQAIGQAVHHNPIAILIPCHRVIGAGGKLTGYASGLHRKQWLLHHEEQNRRESHAIC